MWWCTSAIPALGRDRKEDYESKPSLGYSTRPCLTKTRKNI
jgi:hypothetical protein